VRAVVPGMKRLAVVALACLLGACYSHPPPPPPPYRAVAIAPAAWTLIIDDRHVTFIPGPGQQPLLQPVPKSTVGAAGEIYQTPRINVNIMRRACTDGRTSISYPDSVQVTVDGRLHTGCGGL
jgi:heat shock protein HslJ